MSEEIFDVVDDSDAVIGRERRSEVHRTGLKHRAVHVLVFNAAGNVFLQKRSMSKDTHPGVWDSSASGHLDCGEGYDTCAVREVREELGVTLPVAPRRLFKINACDETGQEFVWIYRADFEGPFQLHPEEISDGQWFTAKQVSDWMGARPGDFAPALLLIWRKLSAAGQ